MTDVGGFRFYVFCIPPIDEEQTLTYGRLNSTERFVMTEEHMNEQMKVVCRGMNLKIHSVDVADGEPPGIIASGRDFQAHSAKDNRGYIMNLAKAFPPDLPIPMTNQILTNQLRPEFVQAYSTPLSSDSLRCEVQDLKDAEGTQTLLSCMICVIMNMERRALARRSQAMMRQRRPKEKNKRKKENVENIAIIDHVPPPSNTTIPRTNYCIVQIKGMIKNALRPAFTSAITRSHILLRLSMPSQSHQLIV